MSKQGLAEITEPWSHGLHVSREAANRENPRCIDMGVYMYCPIHKSKEWPRECVNGRRSVSLFEESLIAVWGEIFIKSSFTQNEYLICLESLSLDHILVPVALEQSK